MKILLIILTLLIYSCSPPSYEELKEKKVSLEKEQKNLEEIEKRINIVINKKIERMRFVEDSLLIESKKRTIVSYNKEVNGSILPNKVNQENLQFYNLLKKVNDEKERTVKLDSLLTK
jgi:hypothetical protein